MRVPGASWKDTLEIAKLAEELGYSCITTGEAWGEDAFTSLAQVAAVTERIRIGTSIVPVFARTPIKHRHDRFEHGQDVRGPLLPGAWR